jgi:flagellar biosynthesis protein FlhA
MAAKRKALVQASPNGQAALWLANLPDLSVPIAVLAIIIALITPLPGFVLDLLIVTDLMLSVVVLMVAMYIRKPADFNVFPTLLLLLTLFRLALNISSSRLILLNGNTGTSAAGHVIESFGSFVVGGNYIIGTVIFLVLIAIQYVVINHGAVRISEVTARFTLDALPGKQMSIDADLNAGLIEEAEARQRRSQLALEAEFYGAMDGASRFTQRDAVAGLLITGINIFAGFLIGVFQHDMDLRHALETYSTLTIGDGLVTVVPALMISISAGLVITRANSDRRLGSEVQRQLFGAWQPLALASGILGALSLFPNMPMLPFLALSGSAGVAAWKLRGKTQKKVEPPAPVEQQNSRESIESLVRLDPLTLEIGTGLAYLLEGGRNSPLLERLVAVRRQLASQLGYILPPVRVVDNMLLESHAYSLLLKGVEVTHFELMPGCELAIGGGGAPPPRGRPVIDPAFGLPAWWIPRDACEAARDQGYTLADEISILGTHLGEVIKRYAHEIFTRQDAKVFCDRVAQEQPKLVEELVPKLLPTVQRVLQNLLREQVPIRDAGLILESIAEGSVMTKNPVLLTEYVRGAIRRTLVSSYLNGGTRLTAYFIEPAIEQMLEGSVQHGEQNSMLMLPPPKVRQVLDRIGLALPSPKEQVVAIASASIRHFLRQISEATYPNFTVLSHNELPPELEVVSLGTI